MALFNLQIKIDTKIMKEQPPANLNLCKKVNGSYTAVFTGASMNPVGSQNQLLENNFFNWTEQYAVSVTQVYKVGLQASASADPQPIDFGQRVDYDTKSHTLNDAVAADASSFGGGAKAGNSFVLGNIPENLRAVVTCKPTPDSDDWMILYVDTTQQTGINDKTLTPINSYGLFWNNRIVTSTIIDYTASKELFEFQFPDGATSLTIRWGYKKPNAPSSVNEYATWHIEDSQ